MGNRLDTDLQYNERSGIPALFYDELSPQCRSCFMLICLLNIDVQLIPTSRSSKKSHRNHQFQTNPAGVIPSLIDGQVILNDAHTILIYLCDKYGCAGFPHLCPREYLPRLIILNMLFYEGCVLYRLYTLIMTEIFQKKCSVINMCNLEKKVIESYDKLEAHLRGQLCMTGNSLTIADLSIVCTVSGLDLIYPVSSQQWPNFRRWFENIKAMDCYKCNTVGVEKLYILLQTQGQLPIPQGLESYASLETSDLARKVTKTLELSTSFPKIRTKRANIIDEYEVANKAVQSFESKDNIRIASKIGSHLTESSTDRDDERPCCSSYNMKQLCTDKSAKKQESIEECSEEDSVDGVEVSSD